MAKASEIISGNDTWHWDKNILGHSSNVDCGTGRLETAQFLPVISPVHHNTIKPTIYQKKNLSHTHFYEKVWVIAIYLCSFLWMVLTASWMSVGT